eukprot:3867927-Amphidinium_carterae.1
MQTNRTKCTKSQQPPHQQSRWSCKDVKTLEEVDPSSETTGHNDHQEQLHHPKATFCFNDMNPQKTKCHPTESPHQLLYSPVHKHYSPHKKEYIT